MSVEWHEDEESEESEESEEEYDGPSICGTCMGSGELRNGATCWACRGSGER